MYHPQSNTNVSASESVAKQKGEVSFDSENYILWLLLFN